MWSSLYPLYISFQLHGMVFPPLRLMESCTFCPSFSLPFPFTVGFSDFSLYYRIVISPESSSSSMNRVYLLVVPTLSIVSATQLQKRQISLTYVSTMHVHAARLVNPTVIIDKLFQLSEQKYYALQPHECNAALVCECSALSGEPERVAWCISVS